MWSRPYDVRGKCDDSAPSHSRGAELYVVKWHVCTVTGRKAPYPHMRGHL